MTINSILSSAESAALTVASGVKTGASFLAQKAYAIGVAIISGLSSAVEAIKFYGSIAIHATLTYGEKFASLVAHVAKTAGGYIASIAMAAYTFAKGYATTHPEALAAFALGAASLWGAQTIYHILTTPKEIEKKA